MNETRELNGAKCDVFSEARTVQATYTFIDICRLLRVVRLVTSFRFHYPIKPVKNGCKCMRHLLWHQNNPAFCPHLVFIRSSQTHIDWLLSSINWLEFVIENIFVYCEARTEFICIIQIFFSIQTPPCGSGFEISSLLPPRSKFDPRPVRARSVVE